MTPEEEAKLPDYAQKELSELREENGKLVQERDDALALLAPLQAQADTMRKQRDIAVEKRKVYDAAMPVIAAAKDVETVQALAAKALDDAAAANAIAVPEDVAPAPDADPAPVVDPAVEPLAKG
jgi:hypothetical protein